MCYLDPFLLLLALVSQENVWEFVKILSKHKMKSHPQLTFLCFVTVILCFLLHQMNHVWQRCCYPRDNKFLQVLQKQTAKKRRDLLTPPLEKECSRNTTLLEYQKTQMRDFFKHPNAETNCSQYWSFITY